MNTKQLKEKILSLAIQGKLVPQDSSDEPVIELLKRINPNIQPIVEDIPFEIPNGWEWCQIGDVCHIARGGSPRPIKEYLTKDDNGINWIKIGDTTLNDKYIRSAKEKIKPEGVSKSRFVHKGDFLLTNSMSFGHPFILDIDGCIHDGWLVISPIKCVYNKDFLYYLLSSSFAFHRFTQKASGGVVNNLNSDKVSNTIFPIPPLAEQHRIAEKVESLFTLIDTIEKDKESIKENIKATRQKILSMAIQGELVPQDPNDEPAIDLLKRINPKFTLIENDEWLPKSWCWCKINDIGKIVIGTTPSKDTKAYYDGDIPFFKPTDLEQGKHTCKSTDHLSELGFEKSRQLPPMSILVTCIGATIGKTGLITVEGSCNQQINAIIPHKDISPLYIYYTCISDFFQNKIKINAPAVTLPILKKNKFIELTIPLPPIAEQRRIVEKLELLFAQLDYLENKF